MKQKRRSKFKQGRVILLTFVLAFLGSCVPTMESASSKRSKTSESISQDSNSEACNPQVQSCQSGAGNGNTSRPTDGQVTETGENIVAAVELRHLIDPYSGNYVVKTSVPKNYKGILYISGLNISTLSNRHVGVRFKFGQALESVVIPATVTRGQGLTPQTDIELLALDMSGKPFEDLLLLYDLYDYNAYDFTSTFEPVQDPYDVNLYCRGLDLINDPTFSLANGTCSAAGTECLYGYAKVKDKGLEDMDLGASLGLVGQGVPITPSNIMVDIDGNGYVNDAKSNKISKCLPDNGVLYSGVDGTAKKDIAWVSGTYGVTTLGSTVLEIGTKTYDYEGPYRSLNFSNWQITGAAAIGTKGLFRSMDGGATTMTTNTEAQKGFESNLFPLYGRMSLNSNVEHISTASATNAPNDTKTINTLSNSGDTPWMDGCNLRTSSFDAVTNEGIGSCNITATIEVVEMDPVTLEVVEQITESKTLKLQILRASEKNDEGDEVLFNHFKTCSNGNSCAQGECCFNNRCWSKTLVSMCPEEAAPSNTQLENGESCNSDFECSSLCCNQSMGKCAVHNPYLTTPVFCSHPNGNQCISKEWCARQNITSCFVVKTGVNELGQQTCALRCYNQETHGECRNGVCVPPTQPAVPSFNAANPDCSNAIDPPTTIP